MDDNGEPVAKVEEEVEEVHDFKNSEMLLPDCVAVETKPWEDAIACLISKQSLTLNVSLFFGIAFSIICARLSAGKEIGEQGFSIQWTFKTLLQIWFARMTWRQVLGPQYKYNSKYKSYNWWVTIALCSIIWVSDPGILGIVPYPRIWIKRANFILVRLFFTLVWYGHLIILPWAFVHRMQEENANTEMEMTKAADQSITLASIESRSKRPANRDLMRKRNKEKATRKLSRTLSFYAKVFRYHDESASKTGLRILVFSFVLEFLSIIAIWPNPIVAWLGGARTWNLIVLIPFCMLLLHDEKSVLIFNHAGYAMLALHLCFTVIPVSASAFMEGIQTHPHSPNYQRGSVLLYHLFMQVIQFVWIAVAKRVAKPSTYSPMLVIVSVLDCMFGNYCIVIGSVNPSVSGFAMLVMFARTVAWEMGVWDVVYAKLFAPKSKAVVDMAHNVTLMESHDKELIQSRSRFMVTTAIGLTLPLWISFESTMTIGTATISKDPINVPITFVVLFFNIFITAAAFMGAWQYRKKKVDDLWRIISYDKRAGTHFPDPDTLPNTWKGFLAKKAFVDKNMEGQWLLDKPKVHHLERSGGAAGGSIYDKYNKKKQKSVKLDKKASIKLEKKRKQEATFLGKMKKLRDKCWEHRRVRKMRRWVRKRWNAQKERFKVWLIAKLDRLFGDCPGPIRKAYMSFAHPTPVEKAKKKKRKKKRWWNRHWKQQYYIVGIMYGTFESTARAADLGFGTCTECVKFWDAFGFATAFSVILPVLILCEDRFGKKIRAWWKEARVRYKETGDLASFWQ